VEPVDVAQERAPRALGDLVAVGLGEPVAAGDLADGGVEAADEQLPRVLVTGCRSVDQRAEVVAAGGLRAERAVGRGGAQDARHGGHRSSRSNGPRPVGRVSSRTFTGAGEGSRRGRRAVRSRIASCASAALM
jgi:hypothetical protein